MSRGTAGPLTVVIALGTAQTIAWASSYYLPAILAAPIASDLGLAPTYVFAALSGALIISGLIGPRVGHVIDTFGGRSMLAVSNLVFAAGLLLLSVADGVAVLITAWILLGIGMGMGLYEAAFATLARIYGANARRTITGITLIAGFASTVGWPLSTFFDARYGWRGACVAWAMLHLVVGLPLNLALPRIEQVSRTPAPPMAAAPGVDPPVARDARFVAAALSFVFAATLFVGTAMAAHLPRLLQLAGATQATALAAGALVGPAQVAARLLEYGFMRRVHPLACARLSTTLHPLGAALLAATGAVAAPVFGVLHGAGNGLLTIVKGTLPLALFGHEGYGRRQGVLMVPARIAQALAPFFFGVCLDRWGVGSLWISAGLSLAALLALCLLPRTEPAWDDTDASAPDSISTTAQQP